MSADRCPGSGRPWRADDEADIERCTVCLTSISGLGSPAVGPVPPHTVDAATGEVWVQVAPPKPEPDPWAVALHGAWWLHVAHHAPTPGTTAWMQAHAVAAEARRLAATDPAIRAAHWREVVEWMREAGWSPHLPHIITMCAERIANGGQP